LCAEFPHTVTTIKFRKSKDVYKFLKRKQKEELKSAKINTKFGVVVLRWNPVKLTDMELYTKALNTAVIKVFKSTFDAHTKTKCVKQLCRVKARPVARYIKEGPKIGYDKHGKSI
jgi:hypothetical protein